MTNRCCKFYQTIFFFCLIELLDGKVLEETEISANDEVIKENFLSNRDLKVCKNVQILYDLDSFDRPSSAE